MASTEKHFLVSLLRYDYNHDHSHILKENTIMQTIKASEFKAKCLSLMDFVNETGNEIIITKNGVPVSKLTPIIIKPKSLFGLNKDTIEITGDILKPVDIEWDALK